MRPLFQNNLLCPVWRLVLGDRHGAQPFERMQSRDPILGSAEDLEGSSQSIFIPSPFLHSYMKLTFHLFSSFSTSFMSAGKMI